MITLKFNKHLFFLFIFDLFYTFSYSQPGIEQHPVHPPGLTDYPGYAPQIHKEIDTLYYPFYNDVQMVRISHRYSYFENPTFFNTDIYEYIQQVPVYLLRDKNGKILKRFNTLGREVSTVNMRSPEDPRQRPYSHIHLKRNAYMGDPKNHGLWGIYPMYVLTEDKKILTGAFDSLGNTFFEPVYESIEYKDSVFIVRKDGKYGVLGKDKNSILEIKYEEINYIDTYRNIIQTKRDGKYGLYWSNGKNFVPEEYDGAGQSEFMPPYYVMTKNGKWYFADPVAKKILKQSFTTNNVRRRNENLLMYDGMWILLDTSGNILCKSKDEIYEMVNENRFLTTKWSSGYNRFLVDSMGNAVKEKSYYYLNKLNENVLMGWYDPEIIDHSGINKPTKAVLLDTDGNQICDEEFDSFEKIDNHFLRAYKNGKMFLINERGKVIIDENIDGAGKLFERVFTYTKDKKSFLFDPLNPNDKSEGYDRISYKSEGMLGVMKGEKYGFLDSNRMQRTEFIYDQIQQFHFGVAQVKIGENWFLIDKNGNILSDDYKMTQDLGGGYFMIKRKDKFGVINNKGEIIVEPEYDKCVTISKKKDEVFGFILRKDNKDGMIGTNGEIIHPFEFEILYDINGHNSTYEFIREGYYAGGWIHKRTTREFYHFNYDSDKNKLEVKENPNMGFEIVIGGKRGVRNWEKKMVIPQKYDNIEAMKFNTFKVYLREKGCGLMDTNGKVIIPLDYVYLRDHYDNYITVGRSYQSDWGLYKYDGTMIADTIYGGFERSHMGMIPFYASFNYRFVKGDGWVHDDKRVGLMDSTGKIMVEANYDSYRIPDQFKDEFLFISTYGSILVNSKGEVLEKTGTIVHPPENITVKTGKKKKGLFKRKKGRKLKFL